MIIKTKHNASVSATINYNLQAEKDYKLLHHSDNLRVPLDPSDERGKQAMTADFNYQVSEQHKHPIGHTVVNFGADQGWDKLDRSGKEQFCADLIHSKGLQDTQYFIVEHRDTDYKHLHLVYNKTDNSGKGIHQDKHAIDDNILTYTLGNKYGLAIPPRTKNFIDNQLKQDPHYLEKVANRPLTNQQKPGSIGKEKLAIYRGNGLLGQARNEHHLGKLAEQSGVPFSVNETRINLDGESLDRGELAAVFSSNRSDLSERKSANKQANKAKEIKANKPGYLQKIERKQSRELARQREKATKQSKEERQTKSRAANRSGGGRQSSGRGL